VFEEVRDAVFVVAFIAGAGFDPDAEGNGFDVGQGFGGDRQAVRQTAYLNTHTGYSLTLACRAGAGRHNLPHFRCPMEAP
jgi:hypothetical protein